LKNPMTAYTSCSMISTSFFADHFLYRHTQSLKGI